MTTTKQVKASIDRLRRELTRQLSAANPAGQIRVAKRSNIVKAVSVGQDQHLTAASTQQSLHIRQTPEEQEDSPTTPA